ncbi:MAG: hypothetical protein K2J78_02545, partial [Muribaculaceae bacterium]|nr:hypothetical protein [Muribaculaceae bacterium]
FSIYLTPPIFTLSPLPDAQLVSKQQQIITISIIFFIPVLIKTMGLFLALNILNLKIFKAKNSLRI